MARRPSRPWAVEEMSEGDLRHDLRHTSSRRGRSFGGSSPPARRSHGVSKNTLGQDIGGRRLHRSGDRSRYWQPFPLGVQNLGRSTGLRERRSFFGGRHLYGGKGLAMETTGRI